MKPRILLLDIDNSDILNDLGTPSICVICNVNHHNDFRVEVFSIAFLAPASRLKAAGLTIVVSYCDNLAPLACQRGFLYRDLLVLADHLVVPCQEMASLARHWAYPDLPISVIEDPW